MKYGFIEQKRSVWPVRSMCRLLKVSHGGFYAWVGRSPSHRALNNERLTGLIRQSFAQSDRTYGSPRVWRDLLAWGERLGENRVARLMRAAHLQARHKRRRLPIDEGRAWRIALRPMCWIDGSWQRLRFIAGPLTSPICGAPKVGCMWQW